jgi:hypothetical protein
LVLKVLAHVDQGNIDVCFPTVGVDVLDGQQLYAERLCLVVVGPCKS